MRKDYEKFFSEFDVPKTPPDLFQRVLSRIWEEKQKRASRRRLVLSAGILIVSLAILIPSAIQLQSEVVSSGLPQFISLIFSDFSLVIAHYQDFLMSVFESLPMFTLALILLGVFMLIESLRVLAQDKKVVYKFRT